MTQDPIGPAELSARMHLRALYFDDLKWCACGDPAEALAFLGQVLGAVEAYASARFERHARAGLEELLGFPGDDFPGPLGLSYLYLLEAVGLTEHGTSIHCSWLTEKGERAVEAIRVFGGDLSVAFEAAEANEAAEPPEHADPIIAALIRAQYDPDIYRTNPDGRHPTCRPRVGQAPPANCDRCGRPIRPGHDYPCPAVPREHRWGPTFETTEGAGS